MKKNLLECWAKSPFINDADVIIIGTCVETSYPEILKRYSEKKVILHSCPEVDQPIFGKLASIMTSTRPKSITVLTVDCSPHCYSLHAAVNEAYYITKSKVPKKHLVILGSEVNEISPEAIRLGRYLSIAEKAVRENPKLVDELSKHSLEQKGHHA